MQMPSRTYNTTDYRFGYNGMEKSGDELTGINGSGYTTEYRQYDPRLGRWLSLDPLMSEFADQSPYVAFDNDPIYYDDPLGLAVEGSVMKDKPKPQKEYKNAHLKARMYAALHGGTVTYFKDGSAKVSKWVKGEYNDGDQTYTASALQVKTFKQKQDEGGDDPHAVPSDNLQKRMKFESYATPVLTFRKPPEIKQGGLTAQQKFAADMYQRYGDFIAPKDLIDKIMRGEVPSGTEIIIAGIGAVPIGKLFVKGGKLLYRSGKKVINVSKKTMKVCFIAGTKISTDKGLVNIEDIKIGDLVWSYNDSTHIKALKFVLDIDKQTSDHLDKLVIGSDTIYTTDEHPFYVSNTWKKVYQLVVGDTLTLINGEKQILSYKERIDTIVTVYNFEVEGFHTYYVGVNGILVHNKPKPIRKITQAATTGKWLKKVDNVSQIPHGCEKVADRAVKELGKGAQYLQITPILRQVGNVNGTNSGWFWHVAAIKDGRVYDMLTGPDGMALGQYLKQFEQEIIEIEIVSTRTLK